MNDSIQRRLPFLDRVRPNGVPRRHQYYEGAKTSCAEYEVAYGFASSLQSLSPSSLPCGGNFRPGLARLSPVACGVLNWSNTGVSRPREFRPRPLAELYVTLSRHTAPVIQPNAPFHASRQTISGIRSAFCKTSQHCAADAASVSCTSVWPTALDPYALDPYALDR